MLLLSFLTFGASYSNAGLRDAVNRATQTTRNAYENTRKEAAERYNQTRENLEQKTENYYDRAKETYNEKREEYSERAREYYQNNVEENIRRTRENPSHLRQLYQETGEKITSNRAYQVYRNSNNLITEVSIIAIKNVPVYDPVTGQITTLDGIARATVSDLGIGGDLGADPVRCGFLLLTDAGYLTHARLIKDSNGEYLTAEEAIRRGINVSEAKRIASISQNITAAYKSGNSAGLESSVRSLSREFRKIETEEEIKDELRRDIPVWGKVILYSGLGISKMPGFYRLQEFCCNTFKRKYNQPISEDDGLMIAFLTYAGGLLLVGSIGTYKITRKKKKGIEKIVRKEPTKIESSPKEEYIQETAPVEKELTYIKKEESSKTSKTAPAEKKPISKEDIEKIRECNKCGKNFELEGYELTILAAKKQITIICPHCEKNVRVRRN